MEMPTKKAVTDRKALAAIEPRIDSVTVSGTVPSVQIGDPIVVFGHNFSPVSAENQISITFLASPSGDDNPIPPAVAIIDIDKADPHRLVSVANWTHVNNLPAGNYLIWVTVKGKYSNSAPVNLVLPQSPQLSSPPPQPATTYGPGGNALKQGDKLLPGDFLISNNGRWQLEFRKSDGNMVLYNTQTGNGVWDIGTNGWFDGKMDSKYPSYYPSAYPLDHTDHDVMKGSADMMVVPDKLMFHYCTMRDDGNLAMVQGVVEAVYDGFGVTKDAPPEDPDYYYAIRTSELPEGQGRFFRVEDNGQICIYDKNADDCVIWRHGLAA